MSAHFIIPGAAFDGWRATPTSRPGTAGGTPVSGARFWLLTVGWRRHGLLAAEEVPAAAWA